MEPHSSRSLMQDHRILLLLGGLVLLFFTIGNLPWQLDDYDQAKQAFTSFQMVNEGKWLYQNTPRGAVATKPPLVGWTSAAIYTATRSWELAWRLPSLLAAVAVLVLLFRSGRSAYGEVAAFVALAAFGLNLLSPRLATLVSTDMPLALVIFVIGILAWNKIRKNEPWRPNDRVIMFVWLTAGMLIKGPVIWAFVLPGIVAYEWWRRRSGVSAFCGVWPWIVSLGIFLIWAIAGVCFVPGFYDQVVLREFLGRFGGEVHRAQPLLFYIPHILQKFAPWSLLVIGFGIVALRQAGWRRGNIKPSPETMWLICWVVGGLLLMSLLPSKRVDRVFPIIPPLCLLLAAQVRSLTTRHQRWLLAATTFAVLFSGIYVGWKVGSGYRDHRDALVRFGREVRHEAAANHWRYGAIASRDEGMLLYLRQTAFTPSTRAVADWNTGKIDALVLSVDDEPGLTPQLQPAPVITRRSPTVPDRGSYLLITRPR